MQSINFGGCKKKLNEIHSHRFQYIHNSVFAASDFCYLYFNACCFYYSSLFFCLCVDRMRVVYTTHLISCIAPRVIVSFGVFFQPFAHISRAPIKNLFARKTTKKNTILLQINNDKKCEDWEFEGVSYFLFFPFLFLCEMPIDDVLCTHGMMLSITLHFLSIKENVLEPYYIHCSNDWIAARLSVHVMWSMCTVRCVLYTHSVCGVW